MRGWLDILKIDKNSNDLIVFHVSIWGLGALFGGLSPPKIRKLFDPLMSQAGCGPDKTD